MLPVFATAHTATPVEIVLARFDEPIEWAEEYQQQAKITVYDKNPNGTLPGSIYLPNVGRESHSYLHHIVTRYDSLAEWTVFSQAGKPTFGYKGHRSGGGHLSQGVAFADYLRPQAHSFFVDTAAFDSANFSSSLRLSYTFDDPALASNATCPSSSEWSPWWDMGWFKHYVMGKAKAQNGTDVIEFYNTYVRPDGPPLQAVQLSYPQGARFSVSAKAIRAHPKAYYEALLQTLSRNADPWAGYYMEWMWPTVFGRWPIACVLPPTSVSPIPHSAAWPR